MIDPFHRDPNSVTTLALIVGVVCLALAVGYARHYAPTATIWRSLHKESQQRAKRHAMDRLLASAMERRR